MDNLEFSQNESEDVFNMNANESDAIFSVFSMSIGCNSDFPGVKRGIPTSAC